MISFTHHPGKSEERYPLSPDEVLLYQHIPKTGGLSLISILDKQFETEEIMPLHSAPSNDLFERYSPEQRARFRLIRGHFTFLPNDRGIYKHISQDPVRMTMLRNPIERVQSAYRYLRRNPSVEVHVKRIVVEEEAYRPLKNTEDERRRQRRHEEAMQQDFVHFTKDEAHFGFMYNGQTRFVLGPILGFPREAGDPQALNDDELFQRARASLDKFAFVGITERFFESVQLLCYTFGWPDVRRSRG